jgi:hypothetical protein
MEKKYKVGSSVKCRIVSLSYIDGLANATMKFSEINAPFLHYADIKVGEKLTVRTTKIIGKWKLDPMSNNI